MSNAQSERIGSDDLKELVEAHLGAALPPDRFEQAERYARRKLDMANERAGRQYGEDGYGDEYLVLLTADTFGELMFSEYTFALYDARQAAQRAREADQEGVTRHGEGEANDDPGSESTSGASTTTGTHCSVRTSRF